ncbi:MAG TPA: efflux RND transporter periplasmic adaptor subunit [Candidatus Barnesiella excrementavium]|uniref:efflux RND transporter periplasmic adaptor subunit n=1 Tax=Barnesiella viscericola TaxID=397865 RepID=UPI001F91CBCE|nr:efflux RND transporter periplasmic adaptor subunit [Barnesiella viscericola]HIY50159.1 efflux RND transporter periplasmic adaptor subunit [Candidatus Barnesiella excrementavium]
MKRTILLTITILSYILWSCSGSSSHEAHQHSDHIEEHDHEHSESEGHDHAAEGHGDEIILKKAEAEAIGLTTKTMKPERFHSVIPCSGTLSAAQGDEMTVVAPVAGVVSLAGRHIADGSQVGKGSVLLHLSSKRLAAGDPASKAYIDYETARKAYERAGELVKDQIISRQEYEQTARDYETARLAYEAMGGSRSGSAVQAPMTGYLKNILVSDGDFVEMGQPLMTLSQNRRLQLRAEVPQRYYKELPTIVTANFKTTYDDRVYDLTQLNGKLLSYGRGTLAGGAYVPVVFELDNRGEVVPGACVEVYLRSSAVDNALVVPVSALTEEQGLYFVYLRLDEEGYKKQEVSIGDTDGANVRILSGLHEGDRVVTRGVYQVKLAANSGVIPEGHSHNH